MQSQFRGRYKPHISHIAQSVGRGVTNFVKEVTPALLNMGHARRRPKRLAEKLKAIRVSLGLSPGEMAARLSVPRQHVLKYERDQSEPSLNTLLSYSRLASVRLEQIVDDDEDLRLPASKQA